LVFRPRKRAASPCSSRGFRPLQRFASRGELPNSSKIPTCRLRCVLRVSHPLDALLPPRPAELVSSRFRSWGLPSEVLLLQAAPYALSSAATLMRLVLFLGRTSASGSSTQPRIPTTGPVFSRGTASDTSLGFCPSEASCQKRFGPARKDRKQGPSRALTTRPKRPCHRRPRVTTASDAVFLFRESHCPLGVSHLVDHLESSKVPQRTGYLFPSRTVPRCRGP
jgi:hypothetical protein